nr:hypothetical protein [Candidatus Cloacimonadota bacterium]
MKSIVFTLILILTFSLLSAATMPDFRLPDMNGDNVSLKSLLGEGPIIIDFWADYCQPCKIAMPYLQELLDKYEELKVVLISLDAPRSQNRAKNYLRSRDYDFINLFDPERSIASILNVSNPPHTFIVDQEGTIVYSHVGFEPGTEKIYEGYIRDLLGIEEEPVSSDKEDCESCDNHPHEDKL